MGKHKKTTQTASNSTPVTVLTLLLRTPAISIAVVFTAAMEKSIHSRPVTNNQSAYTVHQRLFAPTKLTPAKHTPKPQQQNANRFQPR